MRLKFVLVCKKCNDLGIATAKRLFSKAQTLRIWTDFTLHGLSLLLQVIINAYVKWHIKPFVATSATLPQVMSLPFEVSTRKEGCTETPKCGEMLSAKLPCELMFGYLHVTLLLVGTTTGWTRGFLTMSCQWIVSAWHRNLFWSTYTPPLRISAEKSKNTQSIHIHNRLFWVSECLFF